MIEGKRSKSRAIGQELEAQNHPKEHVLGNLNEGVKT